MLKYIFKRIFWAVITLWIVITATFFLMHLAPGNPMAKEGKMPESVKQNIMKHFNLDKPVHEQYWIYLKSVVKFDFGPSMKSNTQTVNQMIEKGFPVSLHLGLQALALAITLGLILGVIAALYHNKWPDYMSMVIAIIGISVPSFIMATLLINFVAVEWKLLPVAQWKGFKYTILPTIALAMMPLATIARLMRSSMLEVLSSDYIKTAKSKGLSQSVVIIKHAIRNAILPVVTILGTTLTNLVTGSFIVEKIFAVPGMGEMFVKGIFNRDYTMIMGVTITYAVILIGVILLVDIAYTFIDPRIKLAGGKSS